MNFLRVLITFAVIYIAYEYIDIVLYQFILLHTACIEMAKDIICSVVVCCGAHSFSKRAALRLIDQRLPVELFGQPVALDAIQKTFRKNFDSFTLGVPISLHLSGPTGTGKSHTCKLIAESLYTRGLESKIVHRFEGNELFMSKIDTDYHQNNLRNWILGNLTLCNRTMFIFENTEKMTPEILAVIQPFLNDKMGGIFIFTTTKVNPKIITMYKELRNEGVKKSRYPVEKYNLFKETMTNSTAKYLIPKLVRKYRMPASYTDDEYLIPGEEIEYHLATTGQAIFLPLELEELKLCILDEFKRLGQFKPSDCKIQKVYDVMDYETHQDDFVSCKDVIEITRWVVNNIDC